MSAEVTPNISAEELASLLNPLATSWEQLAIFLGFDFQQIMEVYKENLSDEDHLSALMDKWLQLSGQLMAETQDDIPNDDGGPVPDQSQLQWEGIVRALREMRYSELADDIVKRHLNTETASLSSSDCVTPSDSVTVEDSSTPNPEQHPPMPNISGCITTILDTNYSSLDNLFKGELRSIASEFFTAGIIRNDILKNPSYNDIITSFKSGLELKKSDIKAMEGHCDKFFNVLYKTGGVFKDAADRLIQEITTSIREKCAVEFTISCTCNM